MEGIYEIINKHINNGDLITEIEEICVLLEIENISYEKRNEILEKVNKHNDSIYNLEKNRSKDISKIKAMQTNHHKYIDNENTCETINKKLNEPLKCDISMYFKKIYESKDLSDIIRLLPSRDNPNFDSILEKILVKLYKEYVEISNFIKSQIDDVKEIFESDLQLINSKIEIIIDYKENSPEQTNDTEGKKNRVVFLKNSSGIPTIFNDLKGYEENYKVFLSLLTSILDGTFKRRRRFVNNINFQNIEEVRGEQERILFTPLEGNVYVILSVFVKKSNSTDLRHRKIVENAGLNYQRQKDALLSLVTNEEYMLNEEMYLEQLTNMLSENIKVMKR